MIQLTAKAREIVDTIEYATLATVCPDGRPWNSPVACAVDQDCNIYWASWVDNQHSQNIRDNGQVFVVIYDSRAPEGTGEGVYLECVAEQLEAFDDIVAGLRVLDQRFAKTHHAPEQFMGSFPRRVFRASALRAWLNDEGDIDGNYVDVRVSAEAAN